MADNAADSHLELICLISIKPDLTSRQLPYKICPDNTGKPSIISFHMDSEFYRLIILIVFLFLFLHLAITILRIRRGRELDRKLDKYTEFLNQAVETRRAYVSATEQAKPLLEKVNSLRIELTEGKARLTKHRSELRESLQEIRQKADEDRKSNFEDRFIAQLKDKFEQHWKVYNSLKKIYCENLGRYQSKEEEYEALTEEEERTYQKWLGEKESVLRFYSGISEQIKIRHPFELLGKKDNS